MGAFDENWAQLEQDVGPLLATELGAQAPVGDPDLDPESGTLAASMTWEDQGGVLTAGSRDSRGPIARWVTRGTRPHSIDPVNSPFLHFYWPLVGHFVNLRHVDHPGTSPNQFHVRAWEASRDQVLQMFKEQMGPNVTAAYLNPWRDKDISE
jgi:hypothetical protein